MSVAIVCASHTPLMYKGPASNDTEQRVRTAFGQARQLRERVQA